MAFPVSAARIVESGLTAQNVSAWESREFRYGQNVAKVLWGGAHFYRLQQMNAAQRVRLAGQFLQDKVKINLSIPVKKIPRKRVRDTTDRGGGPIGSQYTYVPPESRSKPGEFPRADTTLLVKSIFLEGPIWETSTSVVCRVGMPLDYGVRLELQMDRSFLVRTLNEEWGKLRQVLLAQPE